METSVIEAEIAELSKRIAEKRKVLEESHGIIEEKELVASAVKEKIAELNPANSNSQPATSQSPSSQLPVTNSSSKPSYLDSLGPEATERLNVLLQLAVDKGLAKALSELSDDEPFIVDAFHDAISDKYYDELKRHGAL